MSRIEPHPVPCIADVSETVDFIKKSDLESINSEWPRNQECDPSWFACPQKDDLVLAVSHCWVYSAHPDPGCLKKDSLDNLLQKAADAHKPQGSTLVFIDFLSVTQRPVRASEPNRTPEQEKAFALALRAFPQIYLQADAVLHIDVEPRRIDGDLSLYSVPLGALDGVTLLQRGSRVHVVSVPEESLSAVKMFDIVESVGGVEVKSVEEFERAKARLQESKARTAAQGSTWFNFCSAGRCCESASGDVRMRLCPYGAYSPLTAGQKGWVYLERFASMVKGAMVPEDQVDKVAFATSEEAAAEIHDGAKRLREAAAPGRNRLFEAMQYFVDRLEEKHFTAVSLDKANNTGGVGGVTKDSKDSLVQKQLRDKDVVGQLMRELVDDLDKNWEKEQARQRQRQLVLAVNRGDLKAATQLIESGADVNLADGQGVTGMHCAAKGRNLEMVRLLIEKRGDLTRQDVQGNSPAHTIALFTDKLTIDLFETLAPSVAILTLANKAGISAFDRFEVWSGTADSNKPYEPADKLVKSLVASMPGLRETQGVEADRRKSLPKMSDIQVSLVDVKRGDKSTQVPMFHSGAPGEAKREVVWVGMALYMPKDLQESAVKTIAGYLNSEIKTKVYFLSEDIFVDEDCSDGAITLEQKSAAIAEAIDGLPLKGKYTLVDNALGRAVSVVFSKQAQLEHAIFLNPLAWFSEEFISSAGFRAMMGKVSEHALMYRNKEVDKCLDVFGSFMFTRTELDISKARDIYMESLRRASPNFFVLSGDVGEDLRLLTNIYTDLPKWGNVPLTLLCGSYSPTLLVQDTIARMQEHAKAGRVHFVPNSKQWWEVEGKLQIDSVASILIEALQNTRG